MTFLPHPVSNDKILFYRFLNQQYALEALQLKRLKVGRLSELNDPADCFPRLIHTKRKDSEYLPSLLHQFYINSGILCFSRAIKDAVIWSHYADSHRGIALGYEFTHKDPLVKVKYTDERPALDYRDISKLASNPPETKLAMSKAILPAFTTKATSWRYEQEWRMFPSLDEMAMQGAHYFQKDIYPKAVVLGLRCCLNENDILRAYGGEKREQDKLVIQRARFHPENFGLVLETLQRRA